MLRAAACSLQVRQAPNFTPRAALMSHLTPPRSFLCRSRSAHAAVSLSEGQTRRVLRRTAWGTLVASVAMAYECCASPAQACGLDFSAVRCVTTALPLSHASLGLAWSAIQLPVHLVLSVEARRLAATAAVCILAMAVSGSDEVRGVAAFAGFCCRAVFGLTAAAALCVVLAAHSELRGGIVVRLFQGHGPRGQWLTVPGALVVRRDSLAKAVLKLARRTQLVPALHPVAAAGAQFGSLFWLLYAGESTAPRLWGRLSMCLAAVSAVFGAVSSAAQGGASADALEKLEHRLGVTPGARHDSFGATFSARFSDVGGGDEVSTPPMAVLTSRLAGAPTELEALRRGADAFHASFPGTSGLAVATLSASRRRIELLQVAAVDEPQRRALRSALQRRVAADAPDDSGSGSEDEGEAASAADSAVSFVCGDGGPVTADSADWGVDGFSDWAGARRSGLSASQLLTAALIAQNGSIVGFVWLAFSPGSPGFNSEEANANAALRRLCEAVAESVAACRARAAADAAARSAAALAAAAVAAAVNTSGTVASRRRLSIGARTESLRRARSTIKSGSPEAAPEATPVPLALSPAPGLAQLSTPSRSSAPSAGSEDIASMDDFSSEISGPPLALPEFTESATVIYADIAGWTALSGTLSPSEVFAALDALWQRFDTLAIAHGICKIDTLNDTYVAVGGLLPARADHARAALRFALDLHAAAASIGGAFTHAQLRVGLHTGPVAAGMAGLVRPRAGVYGDAANIARRLQSSARPGCVQLSPAARAATGLPLDAAFTVRAGLELRGKGAMNAFVVQAGTVEAAAIRAALDDPLLAPPTAPQPPTPKPRDGNQWSGTAEAATRAADSPSAAAESDAVQPVSPGSPPASKGNLSETKPHAFAAETLSHADAATLSHFGTTIMFSSVPVIGYASATVCAGRADLVGVPLRPATLLAAVLYSLAAAAFTRRVTYRDLRYAPISAGDAKFWICTLLAMHSLATLVASAVTLAEYLSQPQGNCPAALSSSTPRVLCARTYFWTVHFPAFATTLITAQMPHQLMFFPEMLRHCIYAAAIMVIAHLDRSLTPLQAALALAEAAFASVAVPFVVVLACDPGVAVVSLSQRVRTCPRMLDGARRASLQMALDFRARFFDGQALLDAYALAVVCVYACVLSVRLWTASAAPSVREAATEVIGIIGTLFAASAAMKARPMDATKLAVLKDSASAENAAVALGLLRAHLAGASSEGEILAAGADTLRVLYPSAVAAALAVFAEGSSTECVSLIQVDARSEADRGALAAALPADVGALPAHGDAKETTSVVALCHGGGPAGALRDSREVLGGIGAHLDWNAAASGGLPTSQAVTALLTAGPMLVGFVQLHFGLYSSGNELSPLRELCDAIGGAIFVRRAFAVNRDHQRGGSRSLKGSASHPNSVDELKESNQLSEADAAAFAVLDATSAADIELMRSWTSADPDLLDDGELRRLLTAMLHSYGLLRRFRISPTAMAGFVADIASHMNENPFHHFRHAFMVTLTAWRMIDLSTAAENTLGDLGILSLLLAAMCHVSPSCFLRCAPPGCA